MFESDVGVALADGTAEVWRARATGTPASGFRLVLTEPSGRTWEGDGTDLFKCLQAVRRQVETTGTRICCNGARVNARPSPLAASAGGGMVYLIPRWRKPRAKHRVPLFDEAPCSAVATVEEQEAFWRRRTRQKD